MIRSVRSTARYGCVQFRGDRPRPGGAARSRSSLGLIVGLVSTALLHWLYPTVFDLAGVNFLGLVLFTGALLLAGALAVRLGVRQLHTTKRALVI